MEYNFVTGALLYSYNTTQREITQDLFVKILFINHNAYIVINLRNNI